MKLRTPWLIRTAGFVGATLARWWMGTLRFRHRHLGTTEVNPHHTAPGDRYIYAMWHENMLLPAFQFARRDIYVLLSKHGDAQLFAEVCRMLRVPLIRGSTTRGGIEAVRQILRKTGRTAHLAMTPDGPLGPRRRVHAGIAYLAAHTGMPIVPTGFGYDRPWRARSWDRFAVPRPWTLGTCVTAAPISVPPDTGKDQLEHYRRRVDDAMQSVSALAERWAETGRWPGAGGGTAESAPELTPVRAAG
jgi:lysophospholipid acyltransferase (LPLAT)-like uncharacterized protein